MDIVYTNKDGANPELRYSLRTLKNVSHGKVWVFGGAPSWLNRETVMYRPRSQNGSAYMNTRAHIAAACNTPEVSDPFMLWNDDFFAMKKPATVLASWHRGPLEDVLEQFSTNKTPWVKGLRATAAYLASIEITQNPMSYDLHVPMVIDKRGMLSTLRQAKNVKADAVHLRTLYGNLVLHGDGYHMDDPKMLRKSDPFPEGPWLSSSNDTFRSTVEPVLRYLFPNPSVYEKD